MTTRRPRIVLMGTGGTIASRGADALELTRYIARNEHDTVEELLDRFPPTRTVADVVAIDYGGFGSHTITPTHWLELVARIHALAADDPDINGLVLTHGTASLEETAYFLNLTLKVPFPVVLVGSQRPATGLSTDAGINLFNALRTAASPESRGRGVLVVLNDEIHSAREATKTSTLKMHTFRSPDFGVLGHADPDGVVYYRRGERRVAPDTAFDVDGLDALPRVDIVLAYAGADDALIRAAVEAGAEGLVMAGFAPGLNTARQLEALDALSSRDVLVVQSTRAGSGRVPDTGAAQPKGCVLADNLTPQKARILLMLALTRSRDAREVQQLFDTH